MKVYVCGYEPRKEDEQPLSPFRAWENTNVTFSDKRGGWLIDHKTEAQIELDLLNSWRDHVKEHYCKLELEEVDGRFAIVCREHPELTGKA